MVKLPRFSHHRHTGRLRPHHETSYGLLFFVLVLTGGVLLGVTFSTESATTDGGQYDVTAVVNGPRPTKPVVFISPVNGQSFQSNPITAEGTCQAASLVKVFKDGVLAGSALCQANGHFSLQLDLLVGQNTLTAVSYNANDLPGPDSPPVTVTLTEPPGGLGFSSELIIQSTNYYRGTAPGQEVVWPVTLVGGQSPYAVDIDWGDNKSDLVTRDAPGSFAFRHTYQQAGDYLGSFPLIIRATDAAGHTAFLQLTTIVNSDTTGKTSTATFASTNGLGLAMAWPVFGALVFMVVSFWLGERREKQVMLRKFREETQ